jgi:uncharacterized protein (DUF1499 family)
MSDEQTRHASRHRLRPCPASPNCVSSLAEDKRHHLPPIPCCGTIEETIEQIRLVLVNMPRIRIVELDGNYLRAEATSLLFRFVDDVEFIVDAEAGMIHFRSASRIGYSDLGANRARMMRIRRELQGS